MREKKKLILSFVVTFLIGVIVYNLIPKNEKVIDTTLIARQFPEVPAQSSENKEIKNFESLESLEENKDWETIEESNFKIKLLVAGEGYHGNEVSARSGETWLGLFEIGNKFFLKKTKLQIKRVNDPIIDDENGKTGKSVITKDKDQSIFLLKNADFLKPGEISAIFGGDPKSEKFEENTDFISLENGFRREFVYQGESVTLEVKNGVNQRGEKIAALVLDNGEAKQTLHSLEYNKDGNYLGTLYWVGDLDGDGKTDFYLNLYFHDNVQYRNLFLSSKADKGKLVKKIAVFTTTGC